MGWRLPCIFQLLKGRLTEQDSESLTVARPLTFGWEIPRASNSSGCFNGSSITCAKKRKKQRVDGEEEDGQIARSPSNNSHGKTLPPP